MLVVVLGAAVVVVGKFDDGDSSGGGPGGDGGGAVDKSRPFHTHTHAQLVLPPQLFSLVVPLECWP